MATENNIIAVGKLVNDKLNDMMKDNETLYQVDIDKDELWNIYINAFENKYNPIFRERKFHECNTCKHFIVNIGTIVKIEGDKLVSVFDVNTDDKAYKPVFEKMVEVITQRPIKSVFYKKFSTYGAKENHAQREDGTIETYNHFWGKLKRSYVKNDASAMQNVLRDQYGVANRGLTEISLDAIDTVLELINENNLYRGKEFEDKIKAFREIKVEFDKLSTDRQKELFVWKHIFNHIILIKNSVIGTLLMDISGGVGIEEAVSSFESKVAPSNYKRTKSIVTESQKKKLVEEIDREGIRESLYRRHAVSSDVSVNDILFVDRSVKMKDKDPLLDALGIKEDVKKIDVSKLSNVAEIGVEDFIKEVLPKTQKLYIVSSRTFDANQVHVSAPKTEDAPNIFQWNNGFAWSYVGDVTDSDIAKNVKAKGGKIDGALRFSLQWNDNNLDNIDLDARCDIQKNSIKRTIYYGQKIYNAGKIRGNLDVDIINPNNKIAVENIVFDQIDDGTYLFKVHNYSSSNSLTDMFQCEIVFGDSTFRYKYKGDMRPKQFIPVATVTIKNGIFTIKHHLPHNEDTSGQLVPIDMVMLSPNHWLGEKKGNKHYFFITKHVVAKEPFRGFYNEFLDPKYNKFRKSFDLLGSLIKCEPNEDGLSGYGFSETLKKEIYLKADEDMYKVKIGG